MALRPAGDKGIDLLSLVDKLRARLPRPSRRTELILRSLAFLVATLAILLYPKEQEFRSIEDQGLVKRLELSDLIVSHPLILDQSPTYSLKLKKEKYMDVAYTSIAFPFGTYARENDCTIRLFIETPGEPPEVHESRPLGCRGMPNNWLSAFSFDQPIPPGTYTAKLITTSASDDEAVSVYYSTDKDGKKWLRPHTAKPNPTAAEALYYWAMSHPVLGVCFLLCVVGLFLLCLVRQPSAKHWFALVLLLYAANILMARPLSGYDETAHIDMFFHAIAKRSGYSGAEFGSVRKKFYNDAEQLKRDESFLELHNAPALPPNSCPHKVLGSCGHSNPPLWLYSKYADWLDLRWQSIESPESLQWLGRCINILLTLGTLALIYLILGKESLLATVPILILIGAFHTRIPAITNDYPMFLGGLFFGAAGSAALSRGAAWRAAAALTLSFYWLFGFARYIDKSWAAGFIPLVVFSCLFVLVRVSRTKRLGGKSKTVASLLAFVIPLVGLPALIPSLVNALRTFSPAYFAKLPGADSIKSIHKVDWGSASLVLWEHGRSVLGDYVWGHSFYGDWAYYLLFTALGLLVFKGVQRFNQQHGTFASAVVSFSLAVLISVQIMTALAIVAKLNYTGITLQSTSKIRLSAPGIAAFIFFAMYGVRAQLFGCRLNFGVAHFWVTVVVVLYLPAFYLLGVQ